MYLPASIQYRATIGPPAKRHSDGVSLAADGGQILRAYWAGGMFYRNLKWTERLKRS